jgi:hypothetical protein
MKYFIYINGTVNFHGDDSLFLRFVVNHIKRTVAVQGLN